MRTVFTESFQKGEGSFLAALKSSSKARVLNRNDMIVMKGEALFLLNECDDHFMFVCSADTLYVFQRLLRTEFSFSPREWSSTTFVRPLSWSNQSHEVHFMGEEWLVMIGVRRVSSYRIVILEL
jgi:hypothetical protein